MRKIIVILSLLSTPTFANQISQISFDHLNDQGEELLAVCKYRTSIYDNGVLNILDENSFKIYAHASNGIGSARFSYMNIRGSVLAIRSAHTGKVVVSEIDLQLYDLDSPNKMIASTSSNGHYRAIEEKRKVFSSIGNGVNENGALEMTCEAAK